MGRDEALAMHVRAAGHELHNLFTHLLIYSGMLAERLREAEDGQLLASLRHSIDLGIAASRNLMLATRQVDGEPVNVDLRLVLSELQRMGEDRLPESIVVATDYAEDLWTVSVGLVDIYERLARLCHRCCEVLPNGGTVLLRAENVEPTVRSHDSPDQRPGERQVKLTVAAVAGCSESAAVDRDVREIEGNDDLAVPLAELDGAASQSVSGVEALWILRLPAAETGG